MKKNVTINKGQKSWQMDMDFKVVEKTGKNIAASPKIEAEETEAGQENLDGLDTETD